MINFLKEAEPPKIIQIFKKGEPTELHDTPDFTSKLPGKLNTSYNVRKQTVLFSQLSV